MVGTIELTQLSIDTFFDLFHTTLHLRRREILVPVVHRLELTTVDGH